MGEREGPDRRILQRPSERQIEQRLLPCGVEVNGPWSYPCQVGNLSDLRWPKPVLDKGFGCRVSDLIEPIWSPCSWHITIITESLIHFKYNALRFNSHA